MQKQIIAFFQKIREIIFDSKSTYKNSKSWLDQYFFIKFKSMAHNSSNNEKFVEIIKNHLEGLSDVSLTELGKKLFPIMSSHSIYVSMYNCFHTFYTIRINKGQKFQDGSNIILKYAEDLKDKLIFPRVKDLLQNVQFSSGLEQLIEKELNQKKSIHEKVKASLNAKVMNGNLTTTSPSTNSVQSSAVKKPVFKPTSTKPQNIVQISDDSPPQKSIQRISIPSSRQQALKPHVIEQPPLQSNQISDPYEVYNLMDRGVCLCGKLCSMMNAEKDMVFKCIHCNLFFHVECMQRGKNFRIEKDPVKKLNACSPCHLRELAPLKQTVKTLFVGVLRQGKKRHGVTFNLDMMQLKTKKLRVQVRCFRLKQKIQSFILFPDSASFSINNRFQKQFLPLPKQSSLKYRKDQPFLLSQNLINQQNKLTIIQRIPRKQSKDDRIEPENHLIGIYLVGDKTVADLIKQVKHQRVMGFWQSKDGLDRSFRIGDGQDITCEVVKIPLVCTLTIQRIKTPVRGIFCTHYQCFDLSNFLMLTSSSVNPRWLCPLCKQPAYDFKYDVIIGSIIDEFQKYQPTQIMFTKNGQFKVYSNQDVCPGLISTINNLPIDTRHKRPLSSIYQQKQKQTNELSIRRDLQLENQTEQTSVDEDERLGGKILEERLTGDISDIKTKQITKIHKEKLDSKEKPDSKEKNFFIPEDANVISLDD